MVMLITNLVLPSCSGQAWAGGSLFQRLSLPTSPWVVPTGRGPQVTPSGCYAKAKGLSRFSRKCSLTTMVF